MVTILSVSAPKTEKTRKDGKPSRQYFSVEFADASNPFATSRKRNFFQVYDAAGQPIWKGVSPANIATLVGTNVGGRFYSAKVKPYQIGERMVDTYSTVILPHEEINIVGTLKQLGHELATEAAAATSTASQKAEA